VFKPFNNQKVIYDYEKMINHLITKHSMDTEEAIEFIDYNTIRTIPYMGVNAPIIMQNIE
jgi:hypothetical protein